MKDSELLYLEEGEERENLLEVLCFRFSCSPSGFWLVFSCFVPFGSHPPTLGTKPREDRHLLSGFLVV